jgi:hypothetical protein
MKGKREKKHLVNIGATATMTTDETSTFSRRSPARAKMRNQLPQKPSAFFFYRRFFRSCVLFT